MQAETYLLACQRYIELNPLRAAMVEDPAHYRWGSYRGNALGQAANRLRPHALYRSLGQSDKQRQVAYRALFRAELDHRVIDDIRLALNQNQPLGNERFYTIVILTPRLDGRNETRRKHAVPVQSRTVQTGIRDAAGDVPGMEC